MPNYNLPQSETLVSVLNPNATQHELARQRAAEVRRELLLPTRFGTVITDLITPEHIAEFASDFGTTYVYTGGGDGTVRAVASAITGEVQNDITATAANFSRHLEIARNVVLIVGADGNACNIAHSSLGKYATAPHKALRDPRSRIKYLYPLQYTVTNANGEAVQSGLATSAVGVKGAAELAEDLDRSKEKFKRFPRVVRLLGETAVVGRGMWNMGRFSAVLQRNDGYAWPDEELDNLTGFELIGSSIYAKQGRARKVGVQDQRWQPVIGHHKEGPVARSLDLTAMTARVKSGFHAEEPIDFANANISLRITSEEPVPFHVDGEFSDDMVLQTGETLHISLGKIAVPILVVR